MMTTNTDTTDMQYLDNNKYHKYNTIHWPFTYTYTNYNVNIPVTKWNNSLILCQSIAGYFHCDI